MLNALINLDGIANYYGIQQNDESGLNTVINGPDSLQDLLGANISNPDKVSIQEALKQSATPVSRTAVHKENKIIDEAADTKAGIVTTAQPGDVSITGTGQVLQN
jgi:hypothetical protein